MKSFTSLMLVSLLCCLLETLPLSEASWEPMENNAVDSMGVIRKWVENSLEDDAEVQRAYHYYTVVRKMSSTPPGRYYCVAGEEYLLQSKNFPKIYPKGSKMKWIFKTDSETHVKVSCPIIRIHPTNRCKKDKLAIFHGVKFTKGRRRCGRINNYSETFEKNVKITFKSNYDLKSAKGFMCTVHCQGPPTTTTTSTTTTYSPLCPQPAFPPSMPTPVSTCAEIPAEIGSSCTCSPCDDGIALSCNFCTRCDFDIFALLDFTVNVILEPSFTCQDPLNPSGWFFHNSDSITAVRFCLEVAMSHVTFPFAELTSLETLVYQDCSGTLIDLCTPSTRSSISSIEKRTVVPSTRATFPVVLPDAADIPNVVNLFLHDIDLDINSTTLSCPNLEVISIDSSDADIGANSFTHITALRTLIVRVCQEVLVSESFKLTATLLEDLTIEDTCLHTIASDAIQLDGLNQGNFRSTSDIILTFTASETLFEYIPMCPFRQLIEMDCVDLIWTTEIQCRNCGGFWYWSLTDGEIDNINSTCYDTVSTSSMDLSQYINNNGNPCSFINVPYNGCY